ncbi:ATP synthase F1 subunit gamma [Clostridium sp. SYSU_GA19001]|uniref:ATP synthase F1 subunit gamma n=1 Tax=Clostridium caldaquaticum TaxID=2940653 RepID=UPI002076E2EB|nr:ATP synthase F1 subunit gamma [Clostridium caldaquaticum]
MAGTGLVAIKRRIKSVTNTKKITKAMGLVATSKLRKTKEELDICNLYDESFSKILNDVLKDNSISSIYLDGNGSKKKLYIVVTSDTGLCGSFNLNILNRATQEISKDMKNSIIIVIGEKGVSFFNRFNYNLIQKYINIADVPSLGDANEVSTYGLKLYDDSEVGEINVIYTKFFSQTKQEVVVEKLLPFDKVSLNAAANGDNILFEPYTNTFLRDVIPLYMREKMLNFLIHSKTSEQSIRMSAMDGATKNANQLLDKLKLQYNRMRQGAITQEISEIVGGAEAQK